MHGIFADTMSQRAKFKMISESQKKLYRFYKNTIGDKQYQLSLAYEFVDKYDDVF